MSELKIDCVNLNMYGMNSYVVSSEDEAMIVDAAKLSFGYGDYDKLLQGKKLIRVIYTHGHFDHISGSDDLRKKYGGVEHCVHNLDYDFFNDPALNASGYFGSGLRYEAPEIKFEDGDSFKLQDVEFKVIHTPGHTRGGVCYYAEGVLFSGDTLFANGIGRTDLPTGNYSEIENSITEKLFKLDDDVLIYPGHEAYGFKLGRRKKMGIF